MYVIDITWWYFTIEYFSLFQVYLQTKNVLFFQVSR